MRVRRSLSVHLRAPALSGAQLRRTAQLEAQLARMEGLGRQLGPGLTRSSAPIQEPAPLKPGAASPSSESKPPSGIPDVPGLGGRGWDGLFVDGYEAAGSSSSTRQLPDRGFDADARAEPLDPSAGLGVPPERGFDAGAATDRDGSAPRAPGAATSPSDLAFGGVGGFLVDVSDGRVTLGFFGGIQDPDTGEITGGFGGPFVYPDFDPADPEGGGGNVLGEPAKTFEEMKGEESKPPKPRTDGTPDTKPKPKLKLPERMRVWEKKDPRTAPPAPAPAPDSKNPPVEEEAEPPAEAPAEDESTQLSRDPLQGGADQREAGRIFDAAGIERGPTRTDPTVTHPNPLAQTAPVDIRVRRPFSIHDQLVGPRDPLQAKPPRDPSLLGEGTRPSIDPTPDGPPPKGFPG